MWACLGCAPKPREQRRIWKGEPVTETALIEELVEAGMSEAMAKSAWEDLKVEELFPEGPRERGRSLPADREKSWKPLNGSGGKYGADGKSKFDEEYRKALAKEEPEPSLSGEYGNIFWLLLLYTLQGVPMGLFGFVNMEVKEIFKGSFSEQGTFMLAAWPFSLKLFWAPLVDSLYSESMGRRKTWMVPAQVAIGLILLYLSTELEGIFAAKDVTTLTAVFFALYFLCATQDIAVDGWALTMLRPENAGYASTCNAVGQTLGFTIGFMVPLSKFFPISAFLGFWGTTFIASTAAVCLLKRESPTPPDEEIESVVEAYKTMYTLVCQPPVLKLALHLLTRSMPFIPADVMAPGRLQDAGYPKESLASIKLMVTPLELTMPWILAPFTAGDKPLNVIIWAYIPRTLLTLVGGAFALYTGDIAAPIPMAIHAGVFAFVIAQAVISNAMFVSHMSFFAKVSDPAIGGTYMTFLNTVHNLGNMWASTFCLKAADQIKIATGYDGYYALCGACTLYGLLWLVLFRPLLQGLQNLPTSEWRVVDQTEAESDNHVNAVAVPGKKKWK